MQTQIEVKKEILNNLNNKTSKEDGNAENNKKDIEIYSFKGELDETNSDITFKKIYQDINDFSKKIIFNLEGLNYLNSKSIGYIADIFSKTKDKSGILVLASLTEEIDDTLDLVGVKSFIKVFNSNKEAVLFINTLEQNNV